jgi:hypothetical protein
MAQQALVGIVPGTQAIGVGMELREYRIELAQAHDGRTRRHIRAGVAGRFQLAGAIDAFVKQRQLVGRYGGAGRRVRADNRRMRDLDAPILKIAGGVLRAAADAGICLRQSRRPRHT